MISRLHLQFIRCYAGCQAEFSNHINVLFGLNGTGKSTVLEVIHFLATLRSFRSHRSQDLIQNGQDHGRVQARFSIPATALEATIYPRTRTLKRDGRCLRKVEEFCSGLSIVALVPEHEALVSGGSEERRRFLDQTIFSLKMEYASTVRVYQKALQQKQALLKQRLPFHAYEDQVAPWNHQLATTGQTMRQERVKLAERLSPMLKAHFEDLMESHIPVEMEYGACEMSLEEELKKVIRVEHEIARALVGPHRDEVNLLVASQKASARVSQGEKASLLLAVKMSELDLVAEANQEEPILILDDVGATLDQPRRIKLLERLSKERHQTLVSTSSEEVLGLAHKYGGRVLRKRDENQEGLSCVRWTSD